MTNRRQFIKQATAAGIACTVPSLIFPQQKAMEDIILSDPPYYILKRFVSSYA